MLKRLIQNLFGDPVKDLLILKLECLNSALQANDRATSEFYLSKLRTL